MMTSQIYKIPVVLAKFYPPTIKYLHDLFFHIIDTISSTYLNLFCSILKYKYLVDEILRKNIYSYL